MFTDNLTLLRLLKFFSLLIITFIIFGGIAYNLTFSMSEAETREINQSDLPNKLLIATQGSTFKNKLTDGIIDELSDEDFYIKVIDVKNLKEIEPADWTAIVVMYNWEYWRAQKDAAKFLTNNKDNDKMIVVSTSGGNNQMIEGVEGWSSASTLTDVPFLVEQITLKIRYMEGKVSSEWKSGDK